MAKNTGKVNANINGLNFENKTSLENALKDLGFIVEKNGDIYKDGKYLGKSLKQHKLYKYLKEKDIDYKKYNSKKYLPDEAFLNENNKIVYIIEKKYQSGSGSVDEKLQTCEFKKMVFARLFENLGYKIEYIYVLSEWFKKDCYQDVLNFIKYKGCYYYFNEIPLEKLNIA